MQMPTFAILAILVLTLAPPAGHAADLRIGT